MLNLLNAQSGVTFNRRNLLKFGAGMTLLSTASYGAGQRPITGSKPTHPAEHDLKTHIKLIGSLEQEDVYVALDGTLWGIAPNKAPAPICSFHGLARSIWNPLDDGSYSQRSFDIGYFGDLDSKAPLNSLTNPITDETVSPFHFRYGGNEVIHTKESIENKEQSEWQTTGDKLWFTEQRGGTFETPFPPDQWPRESSGEEFHFGSETSYVVSADEINDPTLTRVDYTLFWTAFLSWEPWLLMDGAPGFVMWRGVASKINSPSQISTELQDYIKAEQPNYFDSQAPWEGRASTYESYKKERGKAILQR